MVNSSNRIGNPAIRASRSHLHRSCPDQVRQFGYFVGWTFMSSWPAMLLKCYAPAAHPLKLMHWLTGATDSQTGS